MTTIKRVATALLVPVLFGGLALAANPAFAQATVQGAKAEIKDAQGTVVGTAIFAPDAAGVKLTVQVQGFTGAAAGLHGIHVHTVGKCEPTGFTTAGGHFNPATKQHGLNNPAGHHAGDMPNMTFDAAGNSTFETILEGISLGTDANSILDADGSAVVIHAMQDDLVTDPAGNSGARIACGEVATYAIPAAGMPSTGAAHTSDFLPWLGLLAAIALLATGKRITSTMNNKQ